MVCILIRIQFLFLNVAQSQILLIPDAYVMTLGLRAIECHCLQPHASAQWSGEGNTVATHTYASLFLHTEV